MVRSQHPALQVAQQATDVAPMAGHSSLRPYVILPVLDVTDDGLVALPTGSTTYTVGARDPAVALTLDAAPPRFRGSAA